MFNLLAFAVRFILSPYQLSDKESQRGFLLSVLSLIKARAAQTDTNLDDAIVHHIEFVLNNNALFDYLYAVIMGQLQTAEIFFESASEDVIAELTDGAPESIDPIVIITLITRIIGFINAMKGR